MIGKIKTLVAHNLKRNRKKSGYTLRDLSNKSNVSVSMISKIENCRLLPSISTYIKLTTALDLTLGDLFYDGEVESEEKISIVRSGEMYVVAMDNYIAKPLAYKRKNKKMEPFIFYYPPNGKIPKHFHENEEMLFLIEGKLEFKFAEEMLVLEKGDCVYFNGHTVHGAKAISPEGATAIVVEAIN